jgi:hypothetical protein
MPGAGFGRRDGAREDLSADDDVDDDGVFVGEAAVSPFEAGRSGRWGGASSPGAPGTTSIHSPVASS